MNNSKTVQYFINRFSDMLSKEQKKIVIEKWANEIINAECMDMVVFGKRIKI